MEIQFLPKPVEKEYNTDINFKLRKRGLYQAMGENVISADKRKDRQSNFELLRIVLMLMIVAHHFTLHGGYPYTSDFSWNKGFLMFFGAGGKIGVTVFLLISGYFLIKSGFTWRKLGRLVAQIWGYSLAIVAAAFCLHLPLGTEKELLLYFLPLGYMSWFAHSYLILFVLVPFINKLLLRASKRQLQWFLLFGFLIWYVLPTVTSFMGHPIHIGKSTTIKFVYVYIVGAYLQLYGAKLRISHGLWKAAAVYISIVGLDMLFRWLQILPVNEEAWLISDFGDMESPLALVASVVLFLAFRQMRVPQSKAINTIAATTFGIYLIHDSMLLRPFIWQEVLNGKDWYSSPFFPLYAVVMVIVVFTVCGMIDFLRLKYLEPRYNRWVDILLKKCHLC